MQWLSEIVVEHSDLNNFYKNFVYSLYSFLIFVACFSYNENIKIFTEKFSAKN